MKPEDFSQKIRGIYRNGDGFTKRLIQQIIQNGVSKDNFKKMMEYLDEPVSDQGNPEGIKEPIGRYTDPDRLKR